MEIVDKNNNPIHTATAIWALGEIVKKPDEAMLDYMRGLSPRMSTPKQSGSLCVQNGKFKVIYARIKHNTIKWRKLIHGSGRNSPKNL